VAHLNNPRSIVPQSIMPGYAFLAQAEIRPEQVAGHLRTNRLGGVPYTQAQIDNALVDLRTQVNADSPNLQALQGRYPGATARAFGGNAAAAANGTVTEMDALVAYLQVLGTMVNFRTYDAQANIR